MLKPCGLQSKGLISQTSSLSPFHMPFATRPTCMPTKRLACKLQNSSTLIDWGQGAMPSAAGHCGRSIAWTISCHSAWVLDEYSMFPLQRPEHLNSPAQTQSCLVPLSVAQMRGAVKNRG